MNVLLVHGLGRTPLALFGLARTLRRAGHRPHFFAYTPALEPLPRILRRLTARLQTLAERGQPVGLVGHSLGGLLLRMTLPAVPTLRVRHFVMLGVPNQPPRLARTAWNWFPFRWLARSCGALLANPEMITLLPAPLIPYTLIAGTAGPCGRYCPFGNDLNDGVVAVEETKIRDTDEPLLFPVWHTLMMNNRRVQAAVVLALSDAAKPPHPRPLS
jgi:pimeloyl-ACP methyl ester carboxylesterase